MPSFNSFFHRYWRGLPDGVRPANSIVEDEAIRRTRERVRELEMSRLREQLYRSGSTVARAPDPIILDEAGAIRITDVEETPYNLSFTGTRRFIHPDNQPARPIFFNFGYFMGQYGDETHERVLRVHKRRVRVWPPRRGFDRRLKDWPEHFVEEEYTEEDDWEVVPIPFKLSITQIQDRMRERRARVRTNMQIQKARVKSFELLKDWLTEDEYHSLTVKHELNIISGNYLFSITDDPGNTIHVTDVVQGHSYGSYCLVTRDARYPDGDTLLTKIMLIKTDPEAFLQIGCN